MKIEIIKTIFFLLLFWTLSGNAQTTIVEEDFESWPPAGWTTYQTDINNGWGLCWQTDCGHSGNYAAYHHLCNEGCEKWLISPQIFISGDSIMLQFWERFKESGLEYYRYSGVQISTGSADPEDGEFVELFTGEPGTQPILWTERAIDLAAYAGQNVYIAFKFEGYWHEWFVDDVFIGPESFTDIGITSVDNPTGINPQSGIEDVIVNLTNKGTEIISDFTVNWSVNGMVQDAYNASNLNLLTGQSIQLTLGQYDFDAEGTYNITVEVNLPNDFNPANNIFESTYFILPPVDASLTGISPEGFSPVTGLQNVTVEVFNNGSNPIDSLLINWSVDEQNQQPLYATNLNLEPGAFLQLVVGQYDFSQGGHEIIARVIAPADTDSGNDLYSVYNSIASFWESFEGQEFPPEGWKGSWSLKDKGFTNTPHGDYYYAGQSDNNFFGIASDTLFTPVLAIEPGDVFRFFRKNLGFSPGNLTLLWQEGYDGAIHELENISTEFQTWEEVVVDLSTAEGNNRIGLAVHSNGHGLQYIDLISSDASLYLQDNDLLVKNFESFYLAKQNAPHSIKCTVKNYSTSGISGNSYVVKLMQEPGIELASIPGVSLEAWQEMELELLPVFTQLADYNLYVEIISLTDPNLSNNTTRPEKIYSVPQDIELIDIGHPEFPSPNFPFDFGGDTWTYSSNDLSQSLYYANEIRRSGYIYGVTYYNHNIIHTYQNVPLKVWVRPSEITSLSGGWFPTEEMELVFDGSFELKPGDNTIFIPFEEPVLYNGANNIVIQHFQYDPEFPPGFGALWASSGNGPGRTISLMNSLEADPNEPSIYYNTFTEFTYATFVLQPIHEMASISGETYDENNNPFPNVNITVSGQPISVQSDAEGTYLLPGLPYANYTLTASAFAYNDKVKTVIADEASVDFDFYMELRPKIDLAGKVVGSNNITEPLKDVQIIAEGYESYASATDNTGKFLIENAYGNAPYRITFRKYGFYEQTISVDFTDESIDIGTIVLKQEFISPYQVVAMDQIHRAEISWSDPLSSEKVQLSQDLDNCSFSYTNDINENVWLGNKFINDELITLNSVEMHWDYYLLDQDYVTIDIFNKDEKVIASSKTFLTQRDSTMVIDVPNLTIDGDFFVMVHWQNNEVNTHALCIDWTVSGGNFAYIKYPDGDMTLVSSFLGVSPGAFHLRANVLKAGDTSGVPPLYYNVLGGAVEDIPNASNWSVINPEPVHETQFFDENWPPAESGDYIYAVEAVYEEGVSELSFSNPLSIIVNNENLIEGASEILVYPNPAKELITVDLSLNKRGKAALHILNKLGQEMVTPLPFSADKQRMSLDVSAFPDGVYTFMFIIGTQRYFEKVLILNK